MKHTTFRDITFPNTKKGVEYTKRSAEYFYECRGVWKRDGTKLRSKRRDKII